MSDARSDVPDGYKLSEILSRLEPDKEITFRNEDFAELLLYLASVENTQRELFKAVAQLYSGKHSLDELRSVVDEGRRSDRIFQLLLRKLAENAVDDARG